jgi:transcription initiation factor TFIID subunit 2
VLPPSQAAKLQPLSTSSPPAIKDPAPPELGSVPTPPVRPTIKLKIGGSEDNMVNGSTPTSAKSKTRKPKATPAPLPMPSATVPPQVIETEDVKSDLRKANGFSQSNIGKRKTREGPTLSEDDILAHAAPLKKRTPSSAGPSTPSLPKRNGSGVTLKVTMKNKKVDSVPVQDTPPPLPTEKPQQGKGKDKEDVPSLAPKPKKASTSTQINLKQCKDVMRTIQKLPDALIFARPVDPVADGCPT